MATAVEARLEARKGRLVSEARIPVGMLVDALLLRPHHRCEASLAICSCVACRRLLRRGGVRRTWLRAVPMAAAVEARLEARER